MHCAVYTSKTPVVHPLKLQQSSDAQLTRDVCARTQAERRSPPGARSAAPRQAGMHAAKSASNYRTWFIKKRSIRVVVMCPVRGARAHSTAFTEQAFMPFYR